MSREILDWADLYAERAGTLGVIAGTYALTRIALTALDALARWWFA